MICSVESCRDIAIKRGWCSKHYQRWRTGRNFERSILDENEIIIKGDKAFIILRSTNRKMHCEVARAIVDAKDVDLVKDYKWHFDCGYASTRRRGVGTSGKMYLHRLILDTPLEVDHKDLNRLNNCRSNLRIATHAQNMANKNSYLNNTSGHKNVMYDPRPGRGWYVQISFKGKRYNANYFQSADEAVMARNKLLDDVHGDFARKSNS
jgi:hypothetical protein